MKFADSSNMEEGFLCRNKISLIRYYLLTLHSIGKMCHCKNEDITKKQ